MGDPVDRLEWRIRQAMLDYAGYAQTPVNQAEFGRAVAIEEGREAPYTGSAVSEWATGKSVPTLEALEAIAALARRPKEWIAWGTGPDRLPTASPPPQPEKSHR